jgi:hypothetical protein
MTIKLRMKVMKVPNSNPKIQANSPWVKTAAAVAATYVAGRLLKRMPLGALASVLAPIILAKLKEQKERSSRERPK